MDKEKKAKFEKEIKNYTFNMQFSFRDLYLLKSGIARTCVKCESKILKGQYCFGKGYYNHCLKCGEKKMEEFEKRLTYAMNVLNAKRDLYNKYSEEHKKNNLICSI